MPTSRMNAQARGDVRSANPCPLMTSYMELFKPDMINRTHIGVFTQIWSQLTGMNVMMYYVRRLPRADNLLAFLSPVIHG